MKHTALFILAAIMTIGMSCSKQTQSGKSGTVTFIYTGNVGQRIEPCGCRIPKGGLSRRANAIKSMKAEFPEAITLDSGALLYESVRLNPPFEPVLRAKARLTVNEVKASGIDAVNVSAMDLADTADSLLAYGTEGLPWISANIAWKKDGKLIFPADVVKTAGGLTVGIFGFMDANTLGVPFFDEASPLTVLDPKEAVRSEVEKLRKTCDLVVGLAYMDLPQVEKIVAEVPGIDMVVVSHTRSHNPGSEHESFLPLKSGKTIIARCPDGGRVVGCITLDMVNGSTDFVDAELNKDLRPAEVQAQDKTGKKKSTFRNTFTDLDASIPYDEAINARIKVVMDMWADIEKTVKRKQ